jgi:hypothetical protein
VIDASEEEREKGKNDERSIKMKRTTTPIQLLHCCFLSKISQQVSIVLIGSDER